MRRAWLFDQLPGDLDHRLVITSKLQVGAILAVDDQRRHCIDLLAPGQFGRILHPLLDIGRVVSLVEGVGIETDLARNA